MRILHVFDHSIPTFSGYAFRSLAILREQRRLGWDTVQVTSPKQEGCTEAEEVVDGMLFYRTPKAQGLFSATPALSELELMGELSHRLEQVVRRTKPHVMHAHSPVLNGLPALRVARRTGLPLVYEIRAFWEDAAVDHGTTREGSMRYRLSRSVESFVCRRADAVTTICNGLRSDLASRGIRADKITVIPNAVDVERFKPMHEPDMELRQCLGLADCVTLGFIGSFYAYEGLDLLISTLPAIIHEEPRTRLVLVGGGPQDEALRKLAREHGVAEHIMFTGRVPHDQVDSYYDLIDILVYPRRSIRLTELVTPLKPLEAMAQGRLVVASDVGGHRELIDPDRTGILFRAGDSVDLVRTLLGLVRNPQRWNPIRHAARRFVEAERTWRASVARYTSVYQAVCGGTAF